jgi:hypothetical protein
MSTIAEGVESAVQVDKLRELGCDQIQGYVFSPPRPAADVAGLLARKLEPRKMAAEWLKIPRGSALSHHRARPGILHPDRRSIRRRFGRAVVQNRSEE